MQMEAGEDGNVGSVDDVEQPVGKAAQHGAAHVSIHSLIERRMEAEMLLYSEEFIQKFDAESFAFTFVVAEDCRNLSRGSLLVDDARHPAVNGRSTCGGFQPR
ncbi:hypothetical protein BH10PSE6_BH10PSE6_42390 [soil metagenome]